MSTDRPQTAATLKPDQNGRKVLALICTYLILAIAVGVARSEVRGACTGACIAEQAK